MNASKAGSLPLSYVLITAAHNEERFIEKTIQSVIFQTILPLKWVIVDDGSMDGTGEIVAAYCARYSWIELLTRPQHEDRQFGAKAICFNVAYHSLSGLPYQIIGNLDADISFGPDHMEYLLGKFIEDPKLGVAGTPMREKFHDPVRDGLFNDKDVFGACQLFRRECLEALRGYNLSKRGGIDWAAAISARMLGWNTKSFLERAFFHHRPMGQADKNILRARFDYGRKDYSFGNHPIWELSRVSYQLTRKPLVLGGLLILIGYVSAWLDSEERLVSDDIVEFHRREQLHRLKTVILDLLEKKAKYFHR